MDTTQTPNVPPEIANPLLREPLHIVIKENFPKVIISDDEKTLTVEGKGPCSPKMSESIPSMVLEAMEVLVKTVDGLEKNTLHWSATCLALMIRHNEMGYIDFETIPA